jgi:hypothetical protein
VNKALDEVFSKQNIKNGLKVINIWPFNPNARDGRARFSEMHIATHNVKTLDEDNAQGSNEAMDDHQEWGENGVELQSSSTLQVYEKHVPSRLILMIKN